MADFDLTVVAAEVLEADAALAGTVLDGRGGFAIVAEDGFRVGGEVGFLDGFAIEDDLERSAGEPDGNGIPFRGFVELFCGSDGAVDAAGQFRRESLGIVAEVRHLEFHAIEGGIAGCRGAQGETAVPAGTEAEFILQFEVGVFFFREEPAAPVATAGEGAVADSPCGRPFRWFADIGPMADQPAFGDTIFREERREFRVGGGEGSTEQEGGKAAAGHHGGADDDGGKSPRQVCRCSGRDFRDDFDFHEGVEWELGDLDRAAGRFVGTEGIAVETVHGGEVAEVLEEDRGFDDMGKVETGGGEDRLDIGEDLAGLSRDVCGFDLHGFRMEGKLASAEEEVTRADRLGIGTDSSGSGIRVDSLHGSGDEAQSGGQVERQLRAWRVSSRGSVERGLASCGIAFT